MKFSVCICVYDKDNAQYFKEALESIFDQKLVPNEIVLVVDGPMNQELKNIIHQFKEQTLLLDIGFKVVYLPINKGHGEARRISIEHAQYEIIALADADDLNDYNRFFKQMEIFKRNPSVSVVGSQIMEIEHDTKVPISKKEVPVEDKEIKKYLKTRCPFNQMSVMFKKADVLTAGNYIGFYHNEDYYLWIRMYLNGCTFYNHPDTLVLARVNQEFYNRRGGFKYFSSEYKIQKIMLKHSIISFLRFSFNVMVRFVIQVLLSDSLRGFIFKILFRKGVKNV